MSIRIPTGIVQTTYYGPKSEDPYFKGDSGWIQLNVYFGEEHESFRFEGSYDGARGPAECEGMIRALLLVCGALEVHRIKVNEG